MGVQTIILLVLFPVAAALMVVEYRIMRKPRAERTARQQKILDTDVRASGAYRRNAVRFYPIAVVVMAALVLLLSIPFWLTPEHRVLGIVLGVGAIVFGVTGALAARFFFSAKGRAWVDKTNSQFAEAAESSKPYWFVSFRAGLAVGLVFAILGLALIGVQAIRPAASLGFVVPSVIFLVGIAALVAAGAQRHIDRTS